MRKIEKMEPSRHIKGRFLIWIEGERDPVKVTENEVLSFALFQGKEMEEDEWREMLSAGGASSARALGAKMLGERPLSRKELIRRIVGKGESEEDAVAAADWLEEIGALDDLQFACTIVRHYDRRGYGEQRIKQEFQKRGVPKEYWEEALDERNDQADRILEFLDRRLQGNMPDEAELKRTIGALQRRGFRWEEIRTGLSRYGMTCEEESI